MSSIVPPSSYGTCSATRAAPMELVLGGVSAAPWCGPAQREVAPRSRADVLGLRHLENTSCWQRNATVRVKVKLLAACIPPELSQSVIKKPSKHQKPLSLQFWWPALCPLPQAVVCKQWGPGGPGGNGRPWAGTDAGLLLTFPPASAQPIGEAGAATHEIWWFSAEEEEEEGGEGGRTACSRWFACRGLQKGLARKECRERSRSTPGMAPCSLLPDQEDAIATQVGRALMAPGEAWGCRGTLPWGARPGDPQLWGDTALPVPDGRAGSLRPPGSCATHGAAGALRCLLVEGWAFLGALVRFAKKPKSHSWKNALLLCQGCSVQTLQPDP